MIYRILLFVTIVSQTSCEINAVREHSKPFLFLDSLLSKEDFAVEILDYSYPADVHDILMRFQEAVVENREWAQEYFSENFKEGEGIPYNEKFGVTEEEYQRIKNKSTTLASAVVKSSFPIRVNRTSKEITFTATNEEIEFIELLKIDIGNETLLFNEDTIPYNSEINAPVTTPFGEWHGYSWKKDMSNLGENGDFDIDKVISKIIEVDFGKVKSNGKNLLIIKYKDIDSGKVYANLHISCYIE